LISLGLVYRYDGVSSTDINVLYSYYMERIGSHIDESIAWGVLVAEDVEQGSVYDPWKFLLGDLAIDTLDCDGNLFCRGGMMRRQ
jgi:hypothetical protein